MSRKSRVINKPAVQPAPQAATRVREPVNISLRLTPELAGKLEAYCSATGVSKNGVISLSVSDFLASRG